MEGGIILHNDITHKFTRQLHVIAALVKHKQWRENYNINTNFIPEHLPVVFSLPRILFTVHVHVGLAFHGILQFKIVAAMVSP